MLDPNATAIEISGWQSFVDGTGPLNEKVYARLQKLQSAIANADPTTLANPEFIEGALKALAYACTIICNWHDKVKNPVIVIPSIEDCTGVLTARNVDGAHTRFHWDGSHWRRLNGPRVSRLEVSLETGNSINYIAGIEHGLSASVDRKSAKSAGPAAEFVDADVVAKTIGVNVNRIHQLVGARAIPHYFFPFDESPVFKIAEVKAWANQVASPNKAVALPPKIDVRISEDMNLPLPIGMPESIRDIIGLRQVLTHQQACGIYFLCDGPDVVYVGQSTNVFYRIAAHHLDKLKKFDRAYYFACCEEHLDRTERDLIDTLLPRHNCDPLTKTKKEQAKRQAVVDKCCAAPSPSPEGTR